MNPIKISVCMAAYNGESHIKKQIESILIQLSKTDELIIINDCSIDRTNQIVESFGDDRIELINNSVNLGVIKSFEKAILKASGSIIFLSDQDDIWLSNKVMRTLEFMDSEKYLVVVSDAIVSDENGSILHHSYFQFRNSGSGILKNFFRNSYMGCCMAFDASLKTCLLPFPSQIPMHDEWIGLMCSFLGQVGFLNESLVVYRRHPATQTKLHRSNWKKVILKRMTLLYLVLTQIPKRIIMYNHSISNNSVNK